MIERNNTNAVLDRIFDEILNMMYDASRVPLTGKIIINPDDLVILLDELKATIPKEVCNADQILEEQKSIINKAHAEAEMIVQQAKSEAERIVAIADAEAERLIKQEEIVKEANALAEEIKTNALRYQDEMKAEADEFATATKLEALQYVDNMLEFFENRFSEDLKTMSMNRDSVLFEIQKLNTSTSKVVAKAEDEE